MMRDYVFYTEDDRSPTPSLTFVTVRDDARAKELAKQRLYACDHHLAIAVRFNDEVLFVVRRRELAGDESIQPAG